MEKKKRTRADWTQEQKDQQNRRIKENYKVIGCKVQRPIASAFFDYAQQNGQTVNGLINRFILSTLESAGMLPDHKAPADQTQDQD